MLIVSSQDHHLHHGAGELYRGRMVPCFETPERAEQVLAQLRAVGLGPETSWHDFGEAPLRRVHGGDYVDFLKSAWAQWTALGETGDALPATWPARGLRQDRAPRHIDGQLGFYSTDAGVPITAGTWQAVYASAQLALTGAQALLEGTPSAFALCRPPGHHAGPRTMGGFCYLNNAAIAAQYLRDNGLERVAILDVDYHHGNGTQTIFYDRADVVFASLHGDPETEYPYFLGYAEETGAGAGEGANLNLPLPWGTDGATWLAALDVALERIAGFVPGALVVSLGVDTFVDDPISHFRLGAEHFTQMGAAMADLGLPTLFVMEGGYAVGEIGRNVANVLTGFSAG